VPRRKPKKKRKPTVQQAKLIRYIAAGENKQTAAILAGYSPKNASQSASQALRGLHSTFPDLMDACGLTDRSLIERHLKPLLKASRTKHFAHNGRVRDTRKYTDNDTRLAALDMAFRLKGSFAPVKSQQESRAVSVLVVDLPRPIHTPDDDEIVTVSENE